MLQPKRPKYLDQTYLRGVTDHELFITKDTENNSYLTIKKINSTTDPLVLDGTTYLDNGFFIVEFTPLSAYYNARAFITPSLEIVGYYFDISLGNGVTNNETPYYDDLFLDIVHNPGTPDITTILDEDELQAALDSAQINQDQFNFAHQVCSALFAEITNGQNYFINLNKAEVIGKYFGK